MSTLTIGNVTLENNVILAPMAGVSDLPFRLLCKEMGAGLVCMEMVSAKAIMYNNKNTEELLQIHPMETPVSLQLFGSEPDIVADMAARIEERNFAILDINMGCPVPKVVNNGEGSALMKNPELAAEIVRKTVKAISKPVTVKFRKGFDEGHVNAVEFAKRMEDAGVIKSIFSSLKQKAPDKMYHTKQLSYLASPLTLRSPSNKSPYVTSYLAP